MLHATGAALRNLLNILSLEGAIGLGALILVGYLASMCMNIAIEPGFPRPFLCSASHRAEFEGRSRASAKDVRAVLEQQQESIGGR